MRTLLALALVLCLVPACGGGGGTPGDDSNNNNNNPPPPDPTAMERTQQMLEDCQIEEAILAAQDIVGFLNNLVTGTATAAGFSADPNSATITDNPGTGMVIIPWSLDIDNDMSADATGVIEFFDGGNQPTNPALPLSRWNPFSGGDLDTLADPILMGPPPIDGTQLFTDFNGNNIVEASGQVAAQYSGGSATETTGGVTTSGGGCNVSLGWVAQVINFWLQAFPNVEITGTIQLGADTITGTITTNGTNTATAMMTLNGGETNTFTINLTTGVVTHVP